MFNANIITPQELKEVRKIERARIFDEERKARIFNARQRLIGVDLETLQTQVQERKLRDEAERTEIKAQYMKEQHDVKVMEILERQVEENKKILEMEVDQFRKIYQRKENRREYDLNDPDLLKKSLPCRLGDDDPRITLSSVQKFEGEDADGNVRKKIQSDQQKHWILQQIAERRKREKQKNESEQILLETIKTRDERAKMLDKLEKDCRRQVELATVAYNQALAYEKATERRLREEMELENNKAEINNLLTSDLLTENVAVAQSNLGVGKQIGALYKGMSEAEKREILRTQEAQREEMKVKRAAEAAYEKYWIDLSDTMNKSIYFMDVKNVQEQKEEMQRVFQQNKILSKEQKAHREYIEKVVFTNTPTAAFYNQFNRSTR